MWRYCHYDTSKSVIKEYTWNDEGERITLNTPFKPFLMLECEGDQKTPFQSIYGTSLYRKDFTNSYARWKFVDDYEGRLFFNLSPEQQYLIGKYRRVDRAKFTENPIRTFFLDIEAPSKKEFPKPEDANYEIDLLTIFDTLDGKYHMWGKRPYEATKLDEIMDKLIDGDENSSFLRVTKDDIVYNEIFDEVERMEHFLTFWEANTPDIYTGWNIDGFDTPYIINRIRKIIDPKAHLRLSPVGKVKIKDAFDDFGNPRIEYKIVGVNCMDYMQVFKVFTLNAEKPSWKLDDIATGELGCGKVEYEQGNLADLSEQDWETYSAYNIVDVALLVSLDKKRDFLNIGRRSAYEGFSNITDCLGKIVTITGSIAKSALDKGKVLETKKRSEPISFEGGYVTEPEKAIKTNIATYDITSLYPTIMMALGTSLETKIGKIIQHDGDYIMFELHNKMHRKHKDNFTDFLKENQYCISAADIIFDQKIDGVVNDFVRVQFNNKSNYKILEKQAIADGDEEKAKEYHNLGQITKIFLNSCYGVISATSSSLFDLDLARSITLTGQKVIKLAASLANEFSAKTFGCEEDIVIGGDTDSIFCDFTEIINIKGKSMFTDEGISEFGNTLCKVFEIVLNDGVNDMARNELCCKNPTFNFEREKAAETALFFGKKQYAYYVKNNEGRDLPESKRMKYTGLKVIKSEYSPLLKRFMNEVYRETLSKFLTLGSADCRKHINELVKSHKVEFYNATFFDVSKRSRANNFLKWEPMFESRYQHGLKCPVQVKSSVVYNRLVEDLDLRGKCVPISSGEKIMWAYTKPNQYGILACAGTDGRIPEEFGIEVDYDIQWEKLYLRVVYQLFETIGWVFPNLYHSEMVDLDDLFT